MLNQYRVWVRVRTKITRSSEEGNLKHTRGQRVYRRARVLAHARCTAAVAVVAVTVITEFERRIDNAISAPSRRAIGTTGGVWSYGIESAVVAKFSRVDFSIATEGTARSNLRTLHTCTIDTETTGALCIIGTGIALSLHAEPRCTLIILQAAASPLLAESALALIIIATRLANAANTEPRPALIVLRARLAHTVAAEAARALCARDALRQALPIAARFPRRAVGIACAARRV